MLRKKEKSSRRATTPKTKGVLETSLYVKDLKRSVRFYRRIFGFKTIAKDPRRLVALSVLGKWVLLLFKKGASRTQDVPTDGSGELHLTFAIGEKNFDAWEKWLEKNGIAIEKKKAWGRGGRSLYFRDPDRHLLELATPGVWSIY